MTREAKEKEPGIKVESNFDSPDTRKNTVYFHTRLGFTRVNNHLKIKRMYRRLHASVEYFLSLFISFSPKIPRRSKSKELFHLKPRQDLLQVRKL